MLLCLLMVACPAVPSVAGPVVLSVKAVKSEAGRCTQAPALEVLDAPERWRVLEGEAFRGENDWEVYWNLETDALPDPLPEVRMTCPGVTVARVIVGNEDVEFDAEGHAVTFRLVPNRHRGQLIQTVLHDPEGGLPIDLHHNWEMRRAGRYATGAWPARQEAAHMNYLFAAREALKLMGGFGLRPEDNPFDGFIVLEGFETAFTRGHADFPPHFHIMLYPPGYTGAQVPHFYMDEDGWVRRNSFVAVGVAGSGREFGPGEWCALRDLQGVVDLELAITEAGGLSMRRGPGQEEWLLLGDEAGGPAEAVGVWQGEQMHRRCAVRNDAASGDMAILIESYRDGVRSRVLVDKLTYDPFTGKLRERTRADIALE